MIKSQVGSIAFLQKKFSADDFHYILDRIGGINNETAEYLSNQVRI